MHISTACLSGAMLSVAFTGGSTATYPLIYLLDNDPQYFHPQTKERTVDLLALPASPTANSISVGPEYLSLHWDGELAETIVTAEWLFAHRPGQAAFDAAETGAELWDATYLPRIKSYDAAALTGDADLFSDWLRQTKRFGLTLVTGLSDDENAGVALGQSIGFLRQTNFGQTFRVETMPDPNNLAYTSLALPLHTDLPNQELPPGYQFLHCVKNGASGGESVFADAYAIAEKLRETNPKAFDLLTTVPVPYRFHDRKDDIRVHRPVISLNEKGEVYDVRYSAHLMAAFDMEPELMVEYYGAFRAFMALTRDAEFIISFKLGAGQMVVFDNRRVLHGRAAFNPATGHRLLKGFYVDRGEFDSRIRKLAAA
jgi:gamma-butyrobetaine dioxygenase